MDILLRDIHLISPADNINDIADVLILNGIIEKIGKSGSISKKVKEYNLKGKTGVPGFYDMHVHFRDPGQTYKEDLLSGADAASNGGFTGVLCMPNTNPPVDSPMILKSLLDKTKDFLVDVNFSACATTGREGIHLSPILSLGEAGALAFTDDGSPVSDPEVMRRVLEYTAQINSVVIQHCEDMKLSNKGSMNEGFISTLMGVRGIPSISETTLIARDILLTDYVKNSRYHIQHISCGGSVGLLKNAKKEKIKISGEVCPHHFILTDKECMDYNTNAKMNPPLRTREDVEAILDGLKDDTIDVVCSDHAPHTEYEKSQGFYDAPFGIIGLETAVGLSYTYLVKKKIISFEKMIEKMSINPRRLLKLNEIKIMKGEKVNLTILDTNARWKVDKNKFRSKCRNTPFDEYELQCKPYAVINNNQIFFTKL